MANPIVLLDTWLARIECTAPGPRGQQTALNDLYYNATSISGGGATDVDFAAAVSTAFAAGYKALIEPLCGFAGVRVSRVAPTITPSFLDATDAGAGTNASTMLPTQVTAVLTKGTPFAGRKYRGRIYFPFPTAADVGAGGVVSGGYIAVLAVLCAQFLSNITAGSAGNTAVMTPVLWHRSTRSTTQLTNFSVSSLWGTQRRRGNYGRPNGP